MNKNFQLIRTNPRLTTNVKIVIDNSYNLYLESFNSSKELNDQKYKHVTLNREAYIEDEYPKFYDEIPKSIAFAPKDMNDVDVMYDKYENQFDEEYYAGANEVEDQWYQEEFEYFAPLYLRKNNIPSNFIILRVDNPAIYELISDKYTIGSLTKDNFKTEITDKWKCVSVFDLSKQTNLGKFIDRNVNDNDRFPDSSFFFDTKKYNYSKWSGMDFKSGVYTTKELFLDDKLYYENNHFNFEEFITSGFENNSVIYPFILNFKFLFDDNPATPTKMNKYSCNRYFGFYVDDMELVKIMTSYNLESLKSTVTIKNNVFFEADQIANPFVNELTTSGWAQVGNNIYKINRLSNLQYQIFSKENLTGYDVNQFNQNQCTISYTSGKSYITNIGDIDKYIDTLGESSTMYADLYLIKIDDMYHVLKKDDTGYYIQSDYAITSNTRELRYWKGGLGSEYDVKKSVTDSDGKPIIYEIYRVKFSNIKDFDFDRINTKYADFDYEKYTYYHTPEVKLYANEYLDETTPMRKKTHDLSYDGQYSLMDISSEYIADDEAFEIRGSNTNNPMWNKNQSICKWGYEGSISHSDYVYKLNNSNEYGGEYNRTTNTNIRKSVIKDKPLDYFYRIGELYSNEETIFIGSPYDSNDWISYDDRYGTNWTVNTTTIDLDTEDETSYLTYLTTPLIIGDEYEIYISAHLTHALTYTGTLGVDPNSFDDAIQSVSVGDDIEISVTSTAKSSVFKLKAYDFVGTIYEVTITKKIQNKYYLNQSTNIQTKLHQKYDVVTDPIFNLEHYMSSEFDYFDFFFRNIMYYNQNGVYYEKPYLKYSLFGGGDTELAATSLFKGLEYKLLSIDNMTFTTDSDGNQTMKSIITSNGGDYNNYKMAVILSENYNNYSITGTYDSGYTSYTYVENQNRSISNSNLLQSTNQNGIHVILNEKFKNLLVIVNVNIPINQDWTSLNNIRYFGENHGLYYGKTKDNKYNIFPITGTTIRDYNPDNLTANYFINTINNINTTFVYDAPVMYYYIDSDGNTGQVNMGNFADSNNTISSVSSWGKKYPPFYLQINTPSYLKIKKKSYTVNAIKGPTYNIYDKYLVYSNGKPLGDSYIRDPLAREIKINKADDIRLKVYGREKPKNYKNIYRFDGYYEPVFKDVFMFKPTYYWYDSSTSTYKYYSGNYAFADDLEQFGMVDELMYSKVNEEGNYLKLKDQDIDRSIYPMVDEIGLSQTERNILISSWDKEFYIKTLNQQTLLEDYVAIPKQLIIYPSLATITSVVTETGFNNTKYYGYVQSSGGTFDFSITVRNDSEVPKVFMIGIRWSSSEYGLSSDLVTRQSTGTMLPNATVTINFNVNRPYETSSAPAKEYIKYTPRFDVWDDDTSIVSYSSEYCYIFNNLAVYTLKNEDGEFGTTAVYYTIPSGIEYSFTVDIDDINDKINSNYTAKLMQYVWLGASWSSPVTLSTTSGVVDKNVSLNTVTFSGIELIAADGITFNVLYTTRIAFEVTYTYVIEGTNRTHVYTKEITLNVMTQASPPSITVTDIDITMLGL